MHCGPSVLPSAAGGGSAQCGAGFSNLQLFEIGAAFDSGMPEAQKTVAAAIRTGHPERHWQKGGEASGLFTVKADLLAALEAITGAPMSAPITQGAPGWYHPGRSGTICHGSQGNCPVRRTASPGSGGVRPQSTGRRI
jgi:phenylalanyl-tRNA synthetase beta chain